MRFLAAFLLFLSVVASPHAVSATPQLYSYDCKVEEGYLNFFTQEYNDALKRCLDITEPNREYYCNLRNQLAARKDWASQNLSSCLFIRDLGKKFFQ